MEIHQKGHDRELLRMRRAYQRIKASPRYRDWKRERELEGLEANTKLYIDLMRLWPLSVPIGPAILKQALCSHECQMDTESLFGFEERLRIKSFLARRKFRMYGAAFYRGEWL